MEAAAERWNVRIFWPHVANLSCHGLAAANKRAADLEIDRPRPRTPRYTKSLVIGLLAAAALFCPAEVARCSVCPRRTENAA
jgi:hypothetical protein